MDGVYLQKIKQRSLESVMFVVFVFESVYYDVYGMGEVKL
jgi:hypothetical protein